MKVSQIYWSFLNDRFGWSNTCKNFTRTLNATVKFSNIGRMHTNIDSKVFGSFHNDLRIKVWVIIANWHGDRCERAVYATISRNTPPDSQLNTVIRRTNVIRVATNNKARNRATRRDCVGNHTNVWLNHQPFVITFRQNTTHNNFTNRVEPNKFTNEVFRVGNCQPTHTDWPVTRRVVRMFHNSRKARRRNINTVVVTKYTRSVDLLKHGFFVFAVEHRNVNLLICRCRIYFIFVLVFASVIMLFASFYGF